MSFRQRATTDFSSNLCGKKQKLKTYSVSCWWIDENLSVISPVSYLQRRSLQRLTMKLPAHRAGLPGNVDMIIRSAFLPAYKAGHPADLPVNYSSEEIGRENRRKEE